MPKSKVLYQVLLYFIASYSISNATYTYKASFLSTPIIVRFDSVGAPWACVQADIAFGRVLCTANYQYWCIPPQPPHFFVELYWLDFQAQRPCSTLVFSAMVNSWVNWGYKRELYPFIGEGKIRLLTAQDHIPCCTPWYSCGTNKYRLTVGPLCSGTYVMKLYGMRYPWDENDMNGCDIERPNWYFTSGEAVLTDSRSVAPGFFPCSDDHIRLEGITCMSEPEQDTITADEVMSLLTRYRLHCTIRTRVPEAYLPQVIRGTIEPQGKPVGMVTYVR